MLEMMGFEVHSAANGAEALEVAKAQQPDVLFLDIGMPDMDGYEVARRLRLMPSQTKMTLIALTGWGQDQDRRHSRAAGFDHHVVKPPDLPRLAQLIAVSAA